MNPSLEPSKGEHGGSTGQSTAALVVAVVDDDSIYRAYVAEVLTRQGGMRVIQGGSGAELMELLAGEPVDCVVLDNNLGAETGLVIGDAIRGRYPDPPPIVMLTGEGGERTAVKAFRGGFSDYLSKKNLNPSELLGAVRGAVSRHVQEQTIRAEREELSRLAGRDALTGLNSRDYANALLEELGTRAKRRGIAFALFLIRIHGFPQLQDRLGYVLADRVLRTFASRLHRAAREVDTVARYDAVTFVYVIDKDPTEETMEAIAERLGRQLAFDANFDEVSVKLAPILARAAFPTDGRDPAALAASAEAQLARAAEAGAVAVGLPGGGAAGSGTTIISDRQSDRRGQRRRRVLKRAQILLKRLDSTIDCVIRDMSAEGALLRVNDYFSAPNDFDLLLLDTHTTRHVEVRWQVGNDLGVRFIP
jgi:two-component system cell cycle response regulator